MKAWPVSWTSSPCKDDAKQQQQQKKIQQNAKKHLRLGETPALLSGEITGANKRETNRELWHRSRRTRPWLTWGRGDNT